MSIKSFFLVFFLFVVCRISVFAQDAIIFRDGRVKSVKIIQTDNDKTLFRESDNKKAPEEYVENTKVFMLKFKTRGMWCSIVTVSEYLQLLSLRKFPKMLLLYIIRMEEKSLLIT